jgi:tetratricopeptide (TPR) repeat protein
MLKMSRSYKAQILVKLMLGAVSTWMVGIVSLIVYPLAHALPISNAQLRDAQLKDSKTPIAGATSLLSEGYRHLALRDFAAASKVFEAVLKVNRASVDAMLGLAAVAKESADSQLALEWAAKAVRANQEDVRAHYGEARLILDLGDAELALSRLQKIKIKFPNDLRVKLALAEALSATARDSEAGTVLEQAVQQAPDDPSILHALGLNYITRNRADSALKLYDRLLLQHPEFGPGFIGRGDVLSLLHRDDQALAAYRKAADALPDHALPRLKMAAIQEKLKRYEDAERNYLEAIKLDPKSAFAYNNVAYMSAQRGQNLDKALDWAKRAVGLSPKVAAFHDTLGWVHWIRGEKDMARAALNQALMLDPSHIGARKHLAVVESKTVVLESAASRAKEAVETNQTASAKSTVARAAVEKKPEAEPARAPAEATAESAKSVRMSMNGWRAAWQAKDVERYLSFYARSFMPSKGTRETWATERRQRLANANEIRVEVSGVEVSERGPIIETRFNQQYASSSYQDKTQKILHWIKEDGQWRIQREIQAAP